MNGAHFYRGMAQAHTEDIRIRHLNVWSALHLRAQSANGRSDPSLGQDYRDLSAEIQRDTGPSARQ